MGYFTKIIKKKPKIGFWAGDNNNFRFIDSIIEKLRRDFRVEKYLFVGNENSVKLLEKQLKDCDLAWFEWANGPIEIASKIDSNVPKICRLHRYEAYSDSPKRIDFKKVDTLIFISKSVIERFKEEFPKEFSEVKSLVISNGVDLKKFKTNLERPKGKKIAYAGRFHYHKNPPLLLYCFYSLLKKDPDFQLFLVGDFLDPVIEEYFWHIADELKIRNKIVYEGEIDSVSSWLVDKDYFLQTSLVEGQSVAALEAMACGLKPILHNYSNSDKVFPGKYLFSSIEDCVKMFLSNDFDRQEYYKYVLKNNNIDTQVFKIKEIINKLINEKN